MSYCPNCGSEVKETDSFCGDCGQKLDLPAARQAPTRSEPEGRKRRYSRSTLIVLGLVASFLVACCGVSALLRSKSVDDSTSGRGKTALEVDADQLASTPIPSATRASSTRSESASTRTPAPTPTRDARYAGTPTPTSTPNPTQVASRTPVPTDTPTTTPTPAPACLGQATTTLRLRTGPSTEYAYLGSLEKGETVGILCRTSDSEWYRIRLADGGIRWVAAVYVSAEAAAESIPTALPEYLPPTSTPAPTIRPTLTPRPKVNSVTANVNLRAGPGKNYPVVGGLKKEDVVQIVGKTNDGEWYRIKLTGGTVAWVASGYIKTEVDSNAIPVVASSDIPPVPAPTEAPAQRSAPISLPTAAPGPVCSCDGDQYNCDSFSSWRQAQACHDYCVSIGRGDIHRLDRNNDGVVCESMR